MSSSKVIRKASNSVEAAEPQRCYLGQVPLEILAEILLHTASPREILALSRCSKFFCANLVNNPSTTFIWKQLRSKFHDIPPPTENWTESSYAAFLFDETTCEVCGKKFKGFPFSFSLRLRLCGTDQTLVAGDQDCRKKWINNYAQEVGKTRVNPRYQSLLHWVPRLESVVLIPPLFTGGSPIVSYTSFHLQSGRPSHSAQT